MSGVQIVLLCEDKQTESFVRNFLKHRNFKGRDIETRPLPRSNGGAGEQSVRKQYPGQLKAIRNRKNAYLIVVIDADIHTLDYRHQQLKQECEENHILPRNSSDINVLHIIPRRNIETWLKYLENENNENVNESIKYPKLKRPRDCKNMQKICIICTAINKSRSSFVSLHLIPYGKRAMNIVNLLNE